MGSRSEAAASGVDARRLTCWCPCPAPARCIRLAAYGSRRHSDEFLLGGLDQPHGLAFAGSTLYVAESDQTRRLRLLRRDRRPDRAPSRRGLPDARSPDLGGAYSHALKSVAVGPDGAVYFSIGSTGNISAQDRTASPPRATIMRVPPGGGPAAPFATGVRNGTGLAVAPDGAVWTAVNNRDNVRGPRRGAVPWPGRRPTTSATIPRSPSRS